VALRDARWCGRVLRFAEPRRFSDTGRELRGRRSPPVLATASRRLLLKNTINASAARGHDDPQAHGECHSQRAGRP
jgi:hypothetical protein